MVVAFAARTDVGLRREQNEDNYLVRDDHGLCVVADGMGGHQAGDVASTIAVTTINRMCAKWPDIRARSASNGQREDVEFLLGAISEANYRIFTKGESDEACREMGTTIVAGLFREGYAVIASVGDSRVYRLRRGVLSRLTDDHSWVGELLQKKLLSPEEAMYHPLKNIITRALGMAEEVAIDYRVEELERGDLFMFCTDGLTDLVTDEQIRGLLTRTDDLGELADILVDRANSLGGHDNITVGLVKVAAGS